MTTQEQDKLWNDLSEEKQKSAREMYKQTTRPLDPSKSNAQNEAGIMSFALETTFGSHNLNPKPLTYEDICKALSKDCNEVNVSYITNKQMGEKMRDIHKLLMTAKYLNGDWKPDWKNLDNNEKIWSFGIDEDKIRAYYVQKYDGTRPEIVYFRTKELAEQAIQILGEETIKLAYSNDY